MSVCNPFQVLQRVRVQCKSRELYIYTKKGSVNDSHSCINMWKRAVLLSFIDLLHLNLQKISTLLFIINISYNKRQVQRPFVLTNQTYVFLTLPNNNKNHDINEKQLISLLKPKKCNKNK